MAAKLPSPEQVFRHVPCFCGVLMLASRSVARVYDEEMRGLGVEPTQHMMMSVLRALGPMTLGQLGERVSVDKTTISRNVKLLVGKGWVDVERGQDGREQIVTLMSAGARKLAEAKPHWERAQARMRAALPAGGFESMRKQLPELAIAALSA
jgi:DNA-binding MarR family transcriptional regulator